MIGNQKQRLSSMAWPVGRAVPKEQVRKPAYVNDSVGSFLQRVDSMPYSEFRTMKPWQQHDFLSEAYQNKSILAAREKDHRKKRYLQMKGYEQELKSVKLQMEDGKSDPGLMLSAATSYINLTIYWKPSEFDSDKELYGSLMEELARIINDEKPASDDGRQFSTRDVAKGRYKMLQKMLS